MPVNGGCCQTCPCPSDEYFAVTLDTSSWGWPAGTFGTCSPSLPCLLLSQDGVCLWRTSLDPAVVNTLCVGGSFIFGATLAYVTDHWEVQLELTTSGISSTAIFVKAGSRCDATGDYSYDAVKSAANGGTPPSTPPATVTITTATADSCSGPAKHCYDTWRWDCATNEFTNISTQCLDSDPANTNTWTYVSGTTYEFIQKNGLCFDDSDCTPSTTQPDPPTDLSDCQAWLQLTPCDGGTPPDVGIARENWGTFPSVFKYGDRCYTGAGTVVYTMPSVLITAGDVAAEDSCDVEACAPPPGCADVHCIHVDVYDDTATLQDSFDLDDHVVPGSCQYWAPDVEGGDPSCLFTSKWIVFSGVASGWFGSSAGDSSTFPASGSTWADDDVPTSPSHPTGWYAVVTIVSC